MSDDTLLPFSFPAVQRKRVTAAFDGGRLTSDGGVVLLAEAERRLCLADKLAAVISDHRDPARVLQTLPDILRAAKTGSETFTNRSPAKQPLRFRLDTAIPGSARRFDS
jgi:hypothetical protein